MQRSLTQRVEAALSFFSSTSADSSRQMAFSRYVDAFLKVKIQQQDFIVNGRLLTGQFGLAVSTVGDLNRDGFQDFAVNLNEYLIFDICGGCQHMG